MSMGECVDVTDRGSAPRPATRPFWADDFDMDLLAIVPRLLDEPIVQEAARRMVWCYGSTDCEGRLAHPSVWNDTGALFFSRKPTHPRGRSGAVCIDGHVTFDPLCEASLFEAVRDQWCHGYRSYMDLYPWVDPEDYDSVFYPLMAHRRGWTLTAECDALIERVRAWCLYACEAGIRTIERGRMQESTEC